MAGAIDLRDVTVRYRRTTALDSVDARFESGSLTAVVGQNGAGKSTLLRAVMGLVRLSSGRIDFDGVSRREIAYLPQAHEIDRSFPINVTDFVALGAWSRIGLTRSLPASERERLSAAIERVGLSAHQQSSIGQLSGGQFQRALFARLVMQDAPVLLLDEPFAAVDAQTTIELMQLLREWHAAGRTIVAVLHDLPLVEREFPLAMILERQVLAHGPSATVLAAVRAAGSNAAGPDHVRLVAA